MMAALVVQLGPSDIQTDMVPNDNSPIDANLIPSIELSPDASLYSPTGAFRFNFSEGIGRVQVITDDQLPHLVWTNIWSTNNSQDNGNRCYMQLDGHLVILKSDGIAVFTSAFTKSQFQPVGPFLRMQDDGNLVIYNNEGLAWWATNTNARE
jgi:hypothetical protein